MEIAFCGRYEKDLFFRSVLLANQPSKNSRFVRSFMLVFILVAIVVLIARLVETSDISGNATYIVVVMIVSAFLARSFLQPYLGARNMWANPSVHRRLTGVITKNGIVYRLEEVNNEIPWERFNRVRKANNLVTLVTREGLLIIFPRTFFKNDADWQRFEHLVDTKIVTVY